MKPYLAERIRLGLCKRCGRQPPTGKRMCDGCAQKAATRQEQRRQQRASQNLCVECGKQPPVSERCCGDCNSRRNATINEIRRRLRQEVISHYGRECACCKESRLVFLTIDHIKGGGNQHRKAIATKAGDPFYRWLKENGYPEGYRVLCFNCNCVIGLYGACPHQQGTPEPGG